ncbi:MAG: PAS domain S-box protein [Burkholderiales bacterium]|nr:PAS domain S-box protein [Burkholderiales bacterium]
MRLNTSDPLWVLSPDALVVISPDGRVLHWNPAAELLYGHRQEEAVGQPLLELVVPHDRVQEEQDRQDDVLRQGLVVYESVRCRKDGTPVHVSVSTRVVYGKDGAPAYFLSNQKDVTQLKALRDAKLVQARFQDLLESTPDAILILNVTGRIVLVNSQAEKVFGYTRAELLGQPVELLLPSRFRSAHLGHRGDFFKQPRTRTMGAGLELYGLRKGGEEFPVEISLSPMETDEGLFVSSAIRDVTDRKLIEQTLRDKNRELEEAALAKDRFFASMSHELRTPLNAIIGFSGTLRMKLPGPLNAEQDKQLQIVQTSARHLLSLINDLLDLAKLGANKMELTLETLDCSALLDEVGAALRPEADKKGLDFSLQLPPAALLWCTDSRSLKQIVMNLLGNAIKFTERGSVRMRLQSRVGPNGPTLVISVEDTGPGIPLEDQGLLFDAFSRAQAANRRKLEGSGLGLHLSRKLAEGLGGELSCQSVYGQGSTFTLALPER